MADRPLRPATRRCLGRPLPHQQADRPRVPPEAESISSPGHAARWGHPVLAAVSRCYPSLRGRLLTCYSPVRHSVFSSVATEWTSFDLHVLSTPPAFVLSQDQTLHRDLQSLAPKRSTLRSGEPVSGLLCPSTDWHQDGLCVLSVLVLTSCEVIAPKSSDRARTSFWLSSVPFSRSIAAATRVSERRRCRTALAARLSLTTLPCDTLGRRQGALRAASQTTKSAAPCQQVSAEALRGATGYPSTADAGGQRPGRAPSSVLLQDIPPEHLFRGRAAPALPKGVGGLAGGLALRGATGGPARGGVPTSGAA